MHNGGEVNQEHEIYFGEVIDRSFRISCISCFFISVNPIAY